MNTVRNIIVLAGLGLIVTGCSEDTGRTRVLPGSTITLPRVSPDRTAEAVQRALRSCGYNFDPARSGPLTLVTLPQEYTAKETVAAVADLVAPSNYTFRKTAVVRVGAADPNNTSVSVRVDVQRRDTAPVAAFANQRSGDDRPASVDPGQFAAVSRDRAEVWTNVKRDYEEEQKILDQIKIDLPPAPAK